MKKIFIIVMALIFIGITYLTIEGSKMQEIKTEIDISAPPSKVWKVLTDINNWQQWSPIINASNGEASVGSELSITMMGKEEDKDGPKYNPIITKLDEPNYFRWRAHMLAGFIFTNFKTFELKETSTGTRLIHTESFKGLLAPIFCGQMEKSVPTMLNLMNAALKRKIENSSSE